MTFNRTKGRGKRLDRCVLARPKWTKILETLRKHTCEALKIHDLAPDDTVRVANAHENCKIRRNMPLLLYLGNIGSIVNAQLLVEFTFKT